jgi:hypothetical protein
MRAIVFILILAVVIVIVAVATGFLDLNLRGGKVPQVTTTNNGIKASGGEPPAFEVETGSVKVGATEKTVKVPTLTVQKPDRNQAAPVANNAM